MKYLIFGRKSWLGGKIASQLVAKGNQAIISSADVTDLDAIRQDMDLHKPEVVINAAGKTGQPNIDWCETHREETVAVNVNGAINIMLACQEKKLYMVHLASGCVFSHAGYDQPVSEDAKASPPSFYSWTKFWADEVLKNFPVLILRLRMPVDSEVSPRNLITKLSKYPKVIDVENSVTIVPDLLAAMGKLIESQKTGIYNVVNPGSIKHREILAMYKEIVNPSHQYELIPLEDLYKLGLATANRSNCILSTAKLEKEGVQLRPIKEAMRATLLDYAKNIQQT